MSHLKLHKSDTDEKVRSILWKYLDKSQAESVQCAKQIVKLIKAEQQSKHYFKKQRDNLLDRLDNLDLYKI